MIVVFGANGKTGIEVVKEAMRRGLDVRPVAKNDHDTHRLEQVVDVNQIAFADAEHPEAIKSLSFKMLRVSYLVSILEQLVMELQSILQMLVQTSLK